MAIQAPIFGRFRNTEQKENGLVIVIHMSPNGEDIECHHEQVEKARKTSRT